MEKSSIRASKIGLNLNIESRKTCILSDIIVIDDLILHENNIKCNSIQFNNVIFNDQVILNKLIKYDRIGFQNCEFRNDLIFQNIGLQEATYNKDTTINHQNNTKILLENCKIGAIFFSDSYFDGNIKIFNCEISNLDAANMTLPDHSLIFESCKQISVSRLSNLKCRNILIQNNVFVSKVKIENTKADLLTINKNEFKKICSINLGEIKAIESTYNSFYDTTYFFIDTSTKIFESIRLEKNIVNGYLFIYPSEYEMYNGQNSYEISNMIFYDNSISGALEVDFSETKSIIDIKEFSIKNISSGKGEIMLSDVNINSFRIINYIESSNRLIIRNVIFEKISFEGFSNLGILKFINCKSNNSPQSKFSSNDSVLGDTQFRNFNIDRFNTIELKNTDLSNITISPIPQKPISGKKITSKTRGLNGCEQIKYLFKNLSEDDEAVKSLRQERDIFRQLKLVCEKAGDRSGALYYKSYEMRTLHRELIRTKRFFNANRLLLTLSRTNSYGQNYWWPIIWALGLTILFYIIIFTGISPQLEFKFTLNPTALRESASVLWDNFPLVFKMLNPVYDLNRFPGPLETNSWVWVWFFEYLHKLTLAFFIFQTISAFRKFVK
jgi:hypothetical protein